MCKWWILSNFIISVFKPNKYCVERIKDKLEKKGKFVCAAKWEELYLYLNHGSSNSCHHPIPHKISIDEIRENSAALHNTSHKLAVQTQMLTNETPNECHMCWHLEKENIVSDRFYKSEQWESSIDTLHVNKNHVPKFIEIVFDNLCNLSCSYCDSGQSSSWARILDKTGPWNLKTDNRNLYNKVHIKPGSTDLEFLSAWHEWWTKIKNKVEILKISGGEPLISPNFWKTIEQISTEKLDLKLVLNSNMSVDNKYIKQLLTYGDKVKELRISASIDAVGPMAEFVRNGLDYNLFLSNIHDWCSSSSSNCSMRLQSTVSVLNIWNLTDMFDLNIELRAKYGKKIVDAYSTLVRFPEFQNVSILPLQMRIELQNKMQSWFEKNENNLSNHEKIMIKKTIQYLSIEPDFTKKLNHNVLRLDLQKFLKQYQKMSIHKMVDIYPPKFIKWLEQP